MPNNLNIRQNILGINQTLLRAIRQERPKYRLDHGDLQLIEQLLRTSWKESETRKNLAKQIADSILSKHGKGEAVKIGITTLSDIEGQISALESRIRDHVVHAVLTFLLGVYLNDALNLNVSPLEWKLCALLHDIGYPFEMAIHLPGKIRDDLIEYNRKLRINSPDLTWRWTFHNLEKLTNGGSSLRLITNRFRRWRLQPRSAVLYKAMMKNGNMNHGIVSALLVMKLTDMLYRKHNRNFEMEIDPISGVDYSYKHFDKHIINAVSAIFLHNINRNNFNMLRMNFGNRLHVIPALLKMADELQDWERPQIEHNNSRPRMVVNSAEDYRINANSQPRLLEFSMPEARFHKMRWLENFFEGIEIRLNPIT
ncbi:MAG: hypothetical protein ABIN18_28230 [Pseudomonadota bacterium]